MNYFWLDQVYLAKLIVCSQKVWAAGYYCTCGLCYYLFFVSQVILYSGLISQLQRFRSFHNLDVITWSPGSKTFDPLIHVSAVFMSVIPQDTGAPEESHIATQVTEKVRLEVEQGRRLATDR